MYLVVEALMVGGVAPGASMFTFAAEESNIGSGRPLHCNSRDPIIIQLFCCMDESNESMGYASIHVRHREHYIHKWLLKVKVEGKYSPALALLPQVGARVKWLPWITMSSMEWKVVRLVSKFVDST